MLKITAINRLSGFGVVFAEDVPDVQTTDTVSGESIIFVNAWAIMLSSHSSCLERIVRCIR
jgi:hypothetical protein